MLQHHGRNEHSFPIERLVFISNDNEAPASKDAPAAIVVALVREDVEGGVGNVQLAARRAGVAATFRANRDAIAATERNIFDTETEHSEVLVREYRTQETVPFYCSFYTAFQMNLRYSATMLEDTGVH